VLLPSDTNRKPITSITAVLLPFVAYLLTLARITMDLREIGWGRMDWIDLAQDRDQWRALLNAVMNLQAP
jgi:hypothetical protein